MPRENRYRKQPMACDYTVVFTLRFDKPIPLHGLAVAQATSSPDLHCVEWYLDRHTQSFLLRRYHSRTTTPHTMAHCSGLGMLSITRIQKIEWRLRNRPRLYVAMHSCPSNSYLLSLPIPGRGAHRRVDLLAVSTLPVVKQLESLS